LAQGLQVNYVATGSVASLLAELDGHGEFGTSVQSGDLQVTSMDDAYPPGAPVEPEAQAEFFARSTADAIASGFKGLRVVADASPLLQTCEQIEAFGRWECLADRLMLTIPFSGMCALNRQKLGADTVAALACLHPMAPHGATPFRVYAVEDAELALAGDLDVAVQHEFERALGRAKPSSVGDELVFDGTGLEYFDQRALFSLRNYAKRAGSTAVLRTASSIGKRLIRLLNLEGIRIEQVGFEATAAP
jgi:anti-anti-sigma regulatory factor